MLLICAWIKTLISNSHQFDSVAGFWYVNWVQRAEDELSSCRPPGVCQCSSGLQAGRQAAATDLQTAAAGPSGSPFNRNCICRGWSGVRTRRRILFLCVMWLRRANISASCSFRRRNAASANRVSAEASLCFSFSRFLSREAFTWRRKLETESWKSGYSRTGPGFCDWPERFFWRRSVSLLRNFIWRVWVLGLWDIISLISRFFYYEPKETSSNQTIKSSRLLLFSDLCVIPSRA